MQTSDDRLHGPLRDEISEGVTSVGLVRPARVFDAIFVGEYLRETDRKELSALGHRDHLSTVLTSRVISRDCFAVVRRSTSQPVALFGVASHQLQVGVGIPWLLATDGLEELWKSFAAQSPYWVRRLMAGYEVLSNVVWEKNKLAIRWLKWLGFSFPGHTLQGLHGERFLYFELKKNDNV